MIKSPYPPPGTVTDVLDHTDWLLLAQQKEMLFQVIMEHELPEALEGLLIWLDAIQDAAEADGYPVVFLTEDAEGDAS